MTPHDVAGDSSLRLRFQNEIAYLDRMEGPMDDLNEVAEDTELLGSLDGVRIIAWLWPHPSYEPESDPFEAISRENQVRWTAASRFRDIFESTARAVGRTTDDLKTHLSWSSTLSNHELARLYHAYDRCAFPVIVGLCNALQLEFTDAWVLVNPDGLARRIDESVLASTIADRLRSMSLDNLKSMERRLTKHPISGGTAQDELESGIYQAPKPNGRYWALYEALAADVRDQPDYTLDEIDELLVDAGEPPLPPNARDDRSWWTGNGASPKGRPQVSAWWAAGYRIHKVDVDSSTSQVDSIGFEALPGRVQWLAAPERAAQRQYRVPEKIEIYRSEEDLLLAKIKERRFKSSDFQPLMTDISKVMGILSETANSLRTGRGPLGASRTPDDPDIRHLADFLDQVGEADRSQIEHHFNERLEAPVDTAWLTNLLTKARRQGWTINNGTRSRPRWATTRLIAEMTTQIANALRLETPVIAHGDAVPAEFLQHVAKTVGLYSDGTSALQIARNLIESSGGSWEPEFESADQSVTALGLKAVRDAIGQTKQVGARQGRPSGKGLQ